MTSFTRARTAGLAAVGAGLLIGVAVIVTTGAAPAVAGHATAGHAAEPTAGQRTVAPPPVTHHYSLAASAFAPDSLDGTTNDYSNTWDPSRLTNSSNDRCFNAGLSLPPNVTLTSVKVYYTRGDDIMTFEINRQDLVHHTAIQLAHFAASSTTGTPFYTSKSATMKKADAMVNMTTYAYSAGVCPDGSTTFTGLTITYTEPAG